MPKRKSKRKKLKDFVLVKGSSVGMTTLMKAAENTTIFKPRAIGPSDIMSRYLTQIMSHDKKGQDVVAFDIEAYPQEGDGYIVTAHKSKGSAWGIIPMDFSAAELRVAALGTAEGWGLKPATTARQAKSEPERQEFPREDPPGYWSPRNLAKLLKDGKC